MNVKKTFNRSADQFVRPLFHLRFSATLALSHNVFSNCSLLQIINMKFISYFITEPNIWGYRMHLRKNHYSMCPPHTVTYLTSVMRCVLNNWKLAVNNNYSSNKSHDIYSITNKCTKLIYYINYLITQQYAPKCFDVFSVSSSGSSICS